MGSIVAFVVSVAISVVVWIKIHWILVSILYLAVAVLVDLVGAESAYDDYLDECESDGMHCHRDFSSFMKEGIIWAVLWFPMLIYVCAGTLWFIVWHPKPTKVEIRQGKCCRIARS